MTSPPPAATGLAGRWRVAALVLAGTLAVTTADAATLSGTVTLKGRGAGGSAVSSAVVYFEPDRQIEANPAGSFRIETRGKRFVPRVLAVPVGSRVRFPNRDPILHNVFSVSRSKPFDLGLYGRGEGKEAVFSQAGVVRVYCNVHHSMVAYVVVLSTPFFVQPDAEGRFRLAGLPAGGGKLTVWHERAEPHTQRVSVSGDGRVDVELAISRPRVPRHRNKFGKDYGSRRRDRY